MCPYWCGRWGGVQPHFCPWKNVCFPIFPHGENGKKVYGKKGKSIHFPLFPYTFFPMGKNGKTHIFPWAKMGLDPPPPRRYIKLLEIKQRDKDITRNSRLFILTLWGSYVFLFNCLFGRIKMKCFDILNNALEIH